GRRALARVSSSRLRQKTGDATEAAPRSGERGYTSFAGLLALDFLGHRFLALAVGGDRDLVAELESLQPVFDLLAVGIDDLGRAGRHLERMRALVVANQAGALVRIDLFEFAFIGFGCQEAAEDHQNDQTNQRPAEHGRTSSNDVRI